MTTYALLFDDGTQVRNLAEADLPNLTQVRNLAEADLPNLFTGS
jgi:hypothetical protein